MLKKNQVTLIGIPGFLVAGLLLLSMMNPAAMAQLQFSNPTDFPVGNAPVGMVIGDFNADGKQDLAAVNTGDQNVSILLGNGDGTFQDAVNYPAGTTPSLLAVGDLNQDGKLDLAVANGSANTVSILFGNGDGTFQSPVQYNTGASVDYVAVAYFNDDKKPDLLLASTGGSISILLGNGDGMFQLPIVTQAGGAPYIAIADFNGDGKLDVATASGVLLGNGDGTFQTPIPNSFNFTPRFFAAGDFNGDGKLDLAAEGTTYVCHKYGQYNICTTQTGVWTLSGNGDGTFAAASLVGIVANGECGFGGCNGTWENAFFMAVADLNNDGKPDLVVMDNAVQRCSNSPCGVVAAVLVGVGNGDGTFQRLAFSLGSVPNWVAIGDSNGDTLPDVVVTSSPFQIPGINLPGNLVSVLLNTTPSITLSLTLIGDGGGTVMSRSPVMNCTSSCVGNFAPGTAVTLTAAPNETSIFTGWSGACSGTGTCTVTLNSAESVTATFTALFPLSVALAGSGSGSVTSTPSGINCGSMCSASFVSGTTVTLTATPNATSNFTGWSGACSGTGTCSVTLNAAASATATFALQDFSLTPASTKLTLQPGAQGTDVVTIAGINGPFGSAIQLSCAIAGPAPIPTCALSSASVTPGSNSATSTLTITAPTSTAVLDPPGHRRLSKSLYALWLPLIFGITLVGRSKKQRRRYWVLCGFVLLVLFLQTACGGSSTGGGTKGPTNYTLMVTGVSGTITHTTQVTVTVQ